MLIVNPGNHRSTDMGNIDALDLYKNQIVMFENIVS